MSARRYIRWKLPMLLAVAVATAAPPAGAAIRVGAASLRSGAVTGEGVTLTVRPGAAGTALELRAKRLVVDGWTAPYRTLRFACTLEQREDGSWSCEGATSARRGDAKLAGRLAATTLADAGWRVALRAGDGRATLASADDASIAYTVEAEAMPLAWIGDTLKLLMPGYVLGSGTLDARIAVRDTDDATRTDGRFALRALAFDSTDGEIGADALDATGTIDAHWRDAGTSVVLAATLARGGVLVSPLYAEVGATPAELSITLQQHEGGWHVPSWSYRDADAVDAAGTAELGVDGGVRALDATTLALRFPGAFARYLGSLAAPSGFGKLAIDGAVTGRLRYAVDAPLAGEIRASVPSLVDPAGRFGARGLVADLHLGGAGATPSTLAWEGGTLYGIPLSAARAELAFENGGVRLLAPLEVGLLGGKLSLTRFARAKPAGGEATVEAAMTMQDLSVGALATVMDWPQFGGTLSGTIPAVRGVGDRYTVDGTLALDVFDGHVALGGLSIERPFGVAPSLAADVTFDDLDLKLVTQAFSFGSIEGRLDGRMQHLRLVDWTPVAFDARFRTDPRRGGKQRLSQRAVNSLSSVGGGAAGIQGSLLKIFENFGYDAIGLDLALNANTVTIGGLDDANGGYTIVAGSGIPRLSVVGHQRRVDWQVLVSRLKAATQGTSPVIE